MIKNIILLFVVIWGLGQFTGGGNAIAIIMPILNSIIDIMVLILRSIQNILLSIL